LAESVADVGVADVAQLHHRALRFLFVVLVFGLGIADLVVGSSQAEGLALDGHILIDFRIRLEDVLEEDALVGRKLEWNVRPEQAFARLGRDQRRIEEDGLDLEFLRDDVSVLLRHGRHILEDEPAWLQRAENSCVFPKER
jgi:hypothetical protein